MEKKVNNTPEERLYKALFGEVEADKRTEKFLDRMTGDPGHAGWEPLKYIDEYIDKYPDKIIALDSEGDDAIGEEGMLDSQTYLFKAILFVECCCPGREFQDGILRSFSEFYSEPARAWIDRDEHEVRRYLNEKEIAFLKGVMEYFGNKW